MAEGQKTGGGRREDRDWALHDLVRSFGLNRSYVAYPYLIYILQLVRREPERLEQPAKQIYPRVEREFGVTASEVDGALRTAAKVCWTFRPEVWEHGEEPRRPPTVSPFLVELARLDRLQRERENRT